VLTSAVKMKATTTARSGRAASYKLANQASSAGVWRRESAKRRAHTSFMPGLLLALSLVSGPAGCPACLGYAARSYSPNGPLCGARKWLPTLP
jgi:hypothetical protein